MISLVQHVVRPAASRAAVAALALSFSLRLAAAPSARGTDMLRLGFTYAMFSSVNENDARASIKSLATTIARERRIPAEIEPHLYDGTSAAATAWERGEVNALGVSADEFWLMRNEISVAACLVGVRDEDATESYVVLAHRAAGVPTLADLHHLRLAVTPGPRTCLAGYWFELELAKNRLPPAAEFLDRTVRFAKPAKAVLAVFFRQLEACLVTRRVFDTMVELNPQVGRDLVIVAASPPYIPALFIFSDRVSPEFLRRLMGEFALLHSSAAGQQVLTIFQTDRVAARPLSALGPSLALLDEYARVFPEAAVPHLPAFHEPQLAAKPSR